MPPSASPPYVPIRHTAWPSRRTPRWLPLAGLVLLAAAVLTGIAVHPSQQQRATDLNHFLHDMTTGIQSCAGGVRESLTVLRAIQSGSSHDLPTATRVASFAAANCSPAQNLLLDDLAQYQVGESLSRFRLGRAVKGLLTWAFPDAQRVCADAAALLSAPAAGRPAATARLAADLRRLDGQRAYVNQIMTAAVTATGATSSLPALPG